MLDKGICPSCALPIGTNRCIAVEKIVESLHVNCKNAVWGCTDMVPYSSKRHEHESVCKFRSFRCPVVGCLRECLKSKFRDHFRLAHKVAEVQEPYDGDESKYDIKFLARESAFDKSHSQYALIQVFEDDDDAKIRDGNEDGSLFFVHVQFQEIYRRYSFSCSSFGATRTLERYHLAVNSYRPGGFREKHSTEGPIHDNQKDQALLMRGVRQGDFLLVPKSDFPRQDDILEVQLSLLRSRKI